MLLPIPRLLDDRELGELRHLIGNAEWIDGAATAGHQANLVKHNMQLPEDCAAAVRGGQIILEALARNPLFIAAALPLKIFPPMFNSYSGGQTYGLHVDSAVRIRNGSDLRIRSDLSMTVFLEEPESYDGGELMIETAFGSQTVKLPAGHAVLYPSSSLHKVAPVSRGTRVASFFWIQSMVRDEGARSSLFDLDQSIQSLAASVGQDDPSIVRLTSVYHNLLRRWAEA